MVSHFCRLSNGQAKELFNKTDFAYDSRFLTMDMPVFDRRMASMTRSVALSDDKDLKPRIGVISFLRAA